MTKSELINRLATNTPHLVRRDAELAVHELLSCIHDALVRGERVEIRGFGTLTLRYRRQRIGRNPKSGEKIYVPGKYAPHFKPARELKSRLCGAVTTPVHHTKASAPEEE